MAKVLIVEDDRVIAEGMARHLSSAGFDPVVVGKGEQGLARLRFERPDVVVLDLMLPERDGWSVIEEARSEGIATPIVVVSARGTEHDRIHALEIGADDYLVKPFSMKELVARVRAASRRASRRDDSVRGEPIDIEELRIDPLEVQAFVNGESAGLTPTEFRLLYQLALDRGRVVTRDELLQKIWGRRESHRDRTVDVFIRRLREKIDRRATPPTLIQTRYGAGYPLDPFSKAWGWGTSVGRLPPRLPPRSPRFGRFPPPPGTSRAPAAFLVDHVHVLVLAVGPRDPKEHREPPDRAETALLRQRPPEDELVTDAVEVASRLLADAVHVHLVTISDSGW